MNTYMKMKFHLERHMYKRGEYKGDAPADKRWRSYVRVVKGNDDTMRVRMYSTDIITAYPDGSVKLHTNGWYDRPSTLWRINEAFSFMPYSMAMYHRKVMGVSQPILDVRQGRVLFYDGITLDAEGSITSPLRHFERKQINKAESAELRGDMKESGFTDAFKLLHAVCTSEDKGPYTGRHSSVRQIVTSPDCADDWPALISRWAWGRQYSFATHSYGTVKADAKTTWGALMQHLRKDCYEIVQTDITTL